MATTEEVNKLAALARIRIEDKKLDTFTREFDAILAYVGQLDKLNLSGEKETKPSLQNVMRKDDKPNTPGMFTGKIVAQFPESKNNALVVKQIISHE